MTALPWQTIDKADKSKPQIVGRIGQSDWIYSIWRDEAWESAMLSFPLKPQPTHFLDITGPGTAQEEPHCPDCGAPLKHCCGSTAQEASAVTDAVAIVERERKSWMPQKRAEGRFSVEINAQCMGAIEALDNVLAALRASETKEPT